VKATGIVDAVAEHVDDGACVWLGNFGAQLFAVGHELIRQRRRGLHLVVASGGLVLDQLIGAGVVAEATFAHCWSPVGPQPAWRFRRAWEEGAAIRWHELSIGALCAALSAAARNVPFMPVALASETGYVADDWSGGMIATVASPFGATTVVRALAPDVAFVHAARADDAGNAALDAPAGEAPLAAQAAARVVLVAEQLVAAGTLAPTAVTLPGVLVNAVVEAPRAAWPDGVAGRYDRDVAAYAAYAEAAATPDGFDRWAEQVTA
jgi:glutaconate CoA-transferase subunit A